MALDVRYVLSRDGHIAYETFGAGDLELVVAPGPISHLEVLREQPDAGGFWSGWGGSRGWLSLTVAGWALRSALGSGYVGRAG